MILSHSWMKYGVMCALLCSMMAHAINLVPIDPDYDEQPLLNIEQSASQVFPEELAITPEMFSIGHVTPEGTRVFNAITAYTHTKQQENQRTQTIALQSANSLSQLLWSAEPEKNGFLQIVADMKRAQDGYSQYPFQPFFALWTVLVTNTVFNNMVYFQSFSKLGQFFCKHMPAMQAFLSLKALTSLPYFEQVDRLTADGLLTWSDLLTTRLQQEVPEVAQSFEETGFMPLLLLQKWSHSVMTDNAPDNVFEAVLMTWLRHGASIETLNQMAMMLFTRFADISVRAKDASALMRFFTLEWHDEYANNPQQFASDVQSYITNGPQPRAAPPAQMRPNVETEPAPVQAQEPVPQQPQKSRWGFLRRGQ